MTQPHSTDHNERTWIPPPNGFLKRNLDAAILKEINTLEVVFVSEENMEAI